MSVYKYPIYIKLNNKQNDSMVLEVSILITLVVGEIIIGREQEGVGGMLLMFYSLTWVPLLLYGYFAKIRRGVYL